MICKEKYLPVFEKIAKSFKMKGPPEKATDSEKKWHRVIFTEG